MLVNAAGPWTAEVLHQRLHIGGSQTVRLVKGSHIVVKRLYDGPHAFIFQNEDRRIIFAIPYEGDFTLIGTTDIPVSGDASTPYAEPEEISYLCAAVNQYFISQIGPQDVVWSYSGVRPLFDDGHGRASEVSRDYAFDLNHAPNQAPVLSIFGGKITTHRELALRALEELRPFFPRLASAWTHNAPLPGGDIPGRDIEAFILEVRRCWPFLDERVARRLVRAYGTRLGRFLQEAPTLQALGRDFGYGLSEAELSYLRDSEWAQTGEDVLWRRSKLGLHLTPQAMADVTAWMSAHQR